MKKNPKKRCYFCHEWYQPDVRTRGHQIACRDRVCSGNRRARADRNWRIKHPRNSANWKYKVREWSRDYPYYWRHYRKSHPEYCKRDNRRRVLAARRANHSAKTDAMKQIAVEKLLSIRQIGMEYSAKTDGTNRRVEGIVEYLFWTVENPHSAKYRRYGIRDLSAVG